MRTTFLTDVTTRSPDQSPGRDEGRTETQNAVRDAVRDALRGTREGMQEARIPGAPQAVTAPPAVIEALQAQIAAERLNIEKLTSQLIGGTTDAAENAITSQIESGQERLSSLQRQLDQALGVNEGVPSMALPPMPPMPAGEIIPRAVEDMTYAFFVTVAVIAIGVPLARAFARRMDRRGMTPAPTAPANLEPRLDRLEQAIEAIAIEVERVSEGQRFTNKLMGELRALPAPNPLEQWPKASVKEAVPVDRGGDR